jgi:hypothetical protein
VRSPRFLLLLAGLAAGRASAQVPDQTAIERALRAQDPEDWHRPFPPYKIAANLYYVGTADLASYLFSTSSGNILINTDYKLVNDPGYPRVAEDFERSFSVLKKLPCDIWLSAHGSNFDMKAKYAKLNTGRDNPFIDPAGYQKYIAEHENSFQRELKRQRETGARSRP